MNKVLLAITFSLLMGHSSAYARNNNPANHQQDAQNKFPSSVTIIDQSTTAPKQESPATQPKTLLERLWDAALVNWPLIALGVPGIIYGGRTLKIIRKQTDIMQEQMIIAYRARLAVGQPQKPLGNEIRLPMENYGQFPAHISSITARIKILNGKSDGLDLKESKNVDVTINPGKHSAVSLSLRLPNDFDLFGQGVQVSASGTIDYEIATLPERTIKSTDTLFFYWFYYADIVQWVSGSPAFEIAFANPKTTTTQT